MRIAVLLLCATPLCAAPLRARAQDATVRVRVVHEGVAVPGARVSADTMVRTTDATGSVRLVLASGTHRIFVAKIGFGPDSAVLAVSAGSDTSITMAVERLAEDIEGIVVAATRSERRVEDTPLRVEVIDEEEVAEKVAMTPGDIVMMMNETSGLRVAMTSPSLGGANVRIQGLRGRYTLMLMDGLPLAGAQSGFGLLQIPPVDLARVEVIKGTASALYGSAALGGVINLVSRRPGDEPEREILFNQTSRGGTDAVLYASSPRGLSLLVSAHRQSERDIDGDRWDDLSGYNRLVVRPRVYLGEGAHNLFATAGMTSEDRRGGGVTPAGNAHTEALRTRRFDGGVVARTSAGDRGVAGVRASVTSQDHRHRFGERVEDDSHLTAFAEGSVTLARGRYTLVGGAAYEHDEYRNEQVGSFNYTYRVPSAFAQVDVDAGTWLVLSAAGRVDWHSEFGTNANPRLSALFRLPFREHPGWSVRTSAGIGTFAPTPLTEATEATGVGPVQRDMALRKERARTSSVDLSGPIATFAGRFDVNLSAFASRVRDPVIAREASAAEATGDISLELLNAPLPARNSGGEALVRWTLDNFRVTASYAYLRASEWNAEAGDDTRRELSLAPRHTAGIVASHEREGVSRIGVEVYYTGAQVLDDNPYRSKSRPYVIFGLLAERQFDTDAGRMRVFINAENIGNVRQTRFDPLVRQVQGPGGRWTTDAWTELAGFTLNGGVRLKF
jgi:iron complex outermembrane receptor protein